MPVAPNYIQSRTKMPIHRDQEQVRRRVSYLQKLPDRNDSDRSGFYIHDERAAPCCFANQVRFHIARNVLIVPNIKLIPKSIPRRVPALIESARNKW